MITEFLQDRAALYASGACTEAEREQFELLLDFDDEVRHCARDFGSVGAALTLAALGDHATAASPSLKARILAAVTDRPQQCHPPGFVLAGSDGLVEWVNPAFTALCGYSVEELRGRKLGPILQGKETDPVAAERLQRAVHELRSCHETILNYHKDGTPYWVEIAITPLCGENDQPSWLVAREIEVPAPAHVS